MLTCSEQSTPGVVDGGELAVQDVSDASHEWTQLQLLIIQTNGELGEGRQRETAGQQPNMCAAQGSIQLQQWDSMRTQMCDGNNNSNNDNNTYLVLQRLHKPAVEPASREVQR